MGEGKQILVIDDTELIRTIYRDRLSTEGYEVSLAGDGIEGLQMAVDGSPDLILLDLVMPRQNGLQTLEKLKADPRTQGIPVIILSNRDDQEEIDTGLKLGAVDFLKKVGASPADVTEKIAAVLARQSGETATCDETPAAGFKVYVRDREGDADEVVGQAGLTRRFWCPACEEELQLELVPVQDEGGGHWYKAHFVCGSCCRSF